MLIYYLLLILMPFYEYVYLPKIGESFTLIKMVGTTAVVVAIVRSLSLSRIHILRFAEARLFFLLAFWGALSYLFFSVPLPADNTIFISQFSALFTIFSIGAYLYTTLVFVDSVEHLKNACLVTIFATSLAALSVYNEYIRWGASRPGGVAGDSNYFALEAITVLPLTFTMLADSSTLLRRLFLISSAALILGGMLLGGSRGGFLGLAVTFVYFSIRTRRVKAMLGFGVIGAALLLLLPSSPLRRFLEPNTGDVISQNARIEIVRSGLNMIKAHPVTGVGIARFKPFSGRYNESLGEFKIAHNTYVELAAEMGIPALLMFVSILFCSWRRARRLARYAREQGDRATEQIAIGVEIGLVGASVTAVFLSAEWIRHLWLIVFLGLAIQQMVLRAQTATKQGALYPVPPPQNLRPTLPSQIPLRAPGPEPTYRLHDHGSQ